MIGLFQPGTQQTGQPDKTTQNLLAHRCRLTGEFDQHIEKKAAPFKNIGAQIVIHVIFNEFLDPFQWVRVVADSIKNNAFPDAHGFIINGVPDILLAGEMAVKTAFCQAGGIQYIADGCVIIPFHRKELQ